MSRCKDLIKLSVVYLISIFILFSCHPAHANTPEWITHVTKGKVKYTEAMKIVKWVYAYSVQYEIDPNLIFRLIKVESTFNRKARSKADGQGLMQVVPKWHREKLKGKNLYSVKDNIEVGAQILRQYKDQYSTVNRALRAYNGSHRSNVYPRKVMSVKLHNYTMPYPGSDDRPKQLAKEEAKMLDIQPLFQHDFQSDTLINRTHTSSVEVFRCNICNRIHIDETGTKRTTEEVNAQLALVPCLESPLYATDLQFLYFKEKIDDSKLHHATRI